MSAASYYDKTEFKFAFRLPLRFVISMPLGWVFGCETFGFCTGFGSLPRMPHCEFSG